eukprot:gene4669-5966_t
MDLAPPDDGTTSLPGRFCPWGDCKMNRRDMLKAGLAAGSILRQNSPNPTSAPAPEAAEPLPWSTLAAWLWLSALTCVGMLGATQHLSAEMGSSPLAWVGPFGVFLF